MLLLGHVGITLGTIGLLAGAIGRIGHNTTPDKEGHSSASLDTEAAPEGAAGKRGSWHASLTDNKSLILGSLLPDIIDKPVGLVFCKDKFSNGRIFCHTLLFPAVLAAFGSLFYRRYGKTVGISLSVGAFAHLILDKMWREPKTLFWPLAGLRFKREDTSGWLINTLRGLFTDPEVYKPEIIGGMMLLRLKGRKHAKALIQDRLL